MILHVPETPEPNLKCNFRYRPQGKRSYHAASLINSDRHEILLERHSNRPPEDTAEMVFAARDFFGDLTEAQIFRVTSFYDGKGPLYRAGQLVPPVHLHAAQPYTRPVYG
jgi:hypothetical protein